jgi:hypothetical protein
MASQGLYTDDVTVERMLCNSWIRTFRSRSSWFTRMFVVTIET